jgi:hypothetical protein
MLVVEDVLVLAIMLVKAALLKETIYTTTALVSIQMEPVS